LYNEEGATWEIDDGLQIPQVWNIACEFTYIGKRLPHSLTKHYEVKHLQDDAGTLKGNNFGTFDKDPQDPATASPKRNGKFTKGIK